MTRKQALHKALESVSDEAVRSKIREILEDIPFTNWTERTIFDTIDQFIIDNGRTPTVTDFKKKGLPPHPVIKLRFGMTLKEFLVKHYPQDRQCDSKIYYAKSREEWQEDFLEQFDVIKPYSAEVYNSKRCEGTPSWATVARLFGITKWLGWLSFCKVAPYAGVREPFRDLAPRPEIKVKSVFNLYCKNEYGENEYSFSVTRDEDGEIVYFQNAEAAPFAAPSPVMDRFAEKQV